MKALSLYNITEEQIALMNAIEEAEGELTPELEAQLAINEDNFIAKSNDYTKMIQYYKGFAEQAKAEKMRVAALQQQAERNVERMTNMLVTAMQAFGRDKVTTDTAILSLRHSQALIVDDEAAIPNEFKTFEVKVDKTGIKTAIKAGNAINGAHIQENVSLQIK